MKRKRKRKTKSFSQQWFMNEKNYWMTWDREFLISYIVLSQPSFQWLGSFLIEEMKGLIVELPWRNKNERAEKKGVTIRSWRSKEDDRPPGRNLESGDEGRKEGRKERKMKWTRDSRIFNHTASHQNDSKFRSKADSDSNHWIPPDLPSQEASGFSFFFLFFFFTTFSCPFPRRRIST